MPVGVTDVVVESTEVIRRICVSAALLALGTLGLSASSASAAGVPVPFNASLTGRSDVTGPTTFSWAGTGWATDMGSVTNRGTVVLTGVDLSCLGGLRTVNVETLTATSGDTLTITSHDVGCPAGLVRYHGTGHWTVTGGTGRFRGATGGGSADGGLDFVAGTFTMTLTGTLVS